MKMNGYILIGLIIIALGGLIGGYLIYYGQKIDSDTIQEKQNRFQEDNTKKVIENTDSNTASVIKNLNSMADKVTEEIQIKNSDEEFFITLNKFKTPDSKNDFRYLIETTLSNNGIRDIHLSEIKLIFYQDREEDYTGGKALYANNIKSISVNQNSSLNRTIKFGKNKIDVLDISDDFCGLPFKIRFSCIVSSPNKGTYGYEVLLVENIFEKNGYEVSGYTKGLVLPISIKLLPYNSESKGIKRKYKLN
ncbi:hypothetical protein ACFLR1_02480 [Bacteroidota bacterium]